MSTLFLSYVSCLVAPRPLQVIDAAVSLYGMSGSGFGGWLLFVRPAQHQRNNLVNLTLHRTARP
jgi:hypothetical protein